MKQCKLLHLEKVFYKWFTAVCSEENPVTGPMIIQKVKSFYDEMKKTVKFTVCECWLQTFKQPAAEGRYPDLIALCLVLQPNYRSSIKKLYVRTWVIVASVCWSGIVHNMAHDWVCGCQI